MKELLLRHGPWLGVVATIVGLLTAFGVSLGEYRPVFAGELQEHVMEFVEDKLDRLKKEYYHAKSQEEEYKRRGEAVPKWLVDRIVYLEREIKKLER